MKQELKDKIEKIKNLREAYETALRTVFNDLLAGVAAGFFEEFPEVHGLVWTQYTPHFNDGEPCEFGINETELLLDEQFAASCGPNVSSYRGGRYEINIWNIKQESATGLSEVQRRLQEIEKRRMEFQEFLSEFSMVVQETYGDGYRVTVTPNEVTTEEYEHD